MKQKTKHFCAITLILTLALLLTQSTISKFVYAADQFVEDNASKTDTENPKSLDETISGEITPDAFGDLGGEQFYVAPIGAYVKDVLSGTGTYFSEIHNLFTCIGADASRIAAYCLNPARNAPNTETAYREYQNGNQTSFMSENKSGASAVLMYGYGGESSINNPIVNLSNANANVGGSFGIYVLDGKAQYGLLINGKFYHLDCLEAQAVTAAAIHKLNGSDIGQITSTSGGHVDEANDALYALYQLGNWAQYHIADYGYDATYYLIDANTKPSRSLDITLRANDGSTQNLPANYSDKSFDWTPYTSNGQITFEVKYLAKKCESKLIPSSQSGTLNHITYTHDSMMEFPWEEYANGYYDYFEIQEGTSNTVPISVTYHALCTEDYATTMLGVVSADGVFQTTTGQCFTQTATIKIDAAALTDGNTLDLSIYVPAATSFTPFFGDGDQKDGYYNSGRFFYANGYQDMVVSSPYASVDAFSKKIVAQTEQNKLASFQLTKYSLSSTGAETPLSGAGFMACNTKDLPFVNGAYQFDASKAITLCPDGSKELITDANGYAKSIPLEVGQYLVKETTVPKNHFPVKDFTITISKDSPDLLPVVKCVDQAFEAYVTIYKLDSSTRQPIKNNPATFKIWSYDSNSYVNFPIGDTNTNILKTNANGICKTPCSLSVGKYRLEEVSPPEGYYCAANSSFDFVIDQASQYKTYEDSSFGYEFTIENTPYSGVIELHKSGEHRIWNEDTESYVTSERPLSDITFDIYADEDIYALDGSQNLVYEKDTLIESLLTDENGYAVSKTLPLGGYRLHEQTPNNYVEAEDIYFSISTSDTALEQSINGKITKTLVKTFTIQNKLKEPTLVTSAVNQNTNSKTGEPTTTDYISDTVHYTNLVEGNTYTIRGILMDKSTAQPLLQDGKQITAETDFICTDSEGEISLDFQFDSSALAGHDIVLFDRLYYEGEIICVHEDIDNEAQTIRYEELPIEEAPIVELPPVDSPPIDTPPAEIPPVENPPVEAPPIETPPTEAPPIEAPPAEVPPVEVPPTLPPDIPKTGDFTPILPIMVLCFCAFLSILIFFFRNRISKLIKHIISK